VLTILTITALLRWFGKRRAAARTGLAALALGAVVHEAAAQQRLPADSFPDPARPVSSIVAPRWIAEDRRDAFGEAETVLRALGIRRGMVVADIGAGDGYYVAKLSPMLGDSGRVLAVDIEPRYLALLRRRVTDAGWRNVDPIESLPHDPWLPSDRVDVAILIHMYHEISQPFGLLYHLAFAMKPGGRVGVVDADGPTDRHGTPPRAAPLRIRGLGLHLPATGDPGRRRLSRHLPRAVRRAPAPLGGGRAGCRAARALPVGRRHLGARQPRRDWKNAVSRAPHSASRTPPCTSGR